MIPFGKTDAMPATGSVQVPLVEFDTLIVCKDGEGISKTVKIQYLVDKIHNMTNCLKYSTIEGTPSC